MATAGGGSKALPSTLPFLSQIAEEDLTSASTSVTSFHLPNSIARRNHQNQVAAPGRTLSDHNLFIRLNDESYLNTSLVQDSGVANNKPTSYSHFNFDQSSKQLAKGNSLVSMSSDSVDVPVNGNEANNAGVSRRRGQGTSPSNDESNLALPKTNKATLRKQTQDIAARAAQRRATRHHRELMEDMGLFFVF